MFLNKAYFAVISAVLVLAVALSCQENQTQNSAQSLESFDLIQSRILTPSCAIPTCHASAGDATFAQHELILEKSVAYDNLVGATATNLNAVAAGLLRVNPSDPDGSLLIHKLYIANDHHSGDFGNPMPLGLQKLSQGQLEFIEQWITAGAPRTGTVADASLLDDNSAQEDPFEPIAPPAAGHGFQVNLAKFSISPNFEREFFVYKALGNATDVFVNRVEVNMRLNSHHLVVYDFEPSTSPLLIPPVDVVRDIRNPDNTMNSANMVQMFYHTYVFGSQSPYLNYEFPPGVALRMKANTKLDFNSHYVNKGSQSISGEVNINFHTIPESSVVKEAKPINMGNTSISLNPGELKTINKTFTVANGISVVALTSHTHQMGETFLIRISGGSRNNEVIYTSTDWHHPQYITYDPPIQLLPGEGLTSEVTYHNTKTTIVRFGLTSEDEMGIIFGYYTDN